MVILTEVVSLKYWGQISSGRLWSVLCEFYSISLQNSFEGFQFSAQIMRDKLYHQ